MDRQKNRNLTHFITKINNTLYRLIGLATTATLAISLSACDGAEVLEDDPNASPDLDDKAMLIMGGRLYDNWIKQKRDNGMTVTLPETIVGTTDNSIVWDTLRDTTTVNPHSGEDTWRCVVCHGWDYKGVDGDFATTNYTGFPGLWGNFDALDDEHKMAHIIETISDGFIDLNDPAQPQPANRIHAFAGDEMLSEPEIEALATFIVNGMIDTDRYISADFKFARGDDLNGAALFQSPDLEPTAECAGCHHLNNQVDVPDLIEIGNLSRDNPYRALHAIRFGKPGKLVQFSVETVMRGMIADDWTTHESTDVLTFIQTLPATVPPAAQ